MADVAKMRRRPSELVLDDHKSGTPVCYPKNPFDSIQRLYRVSESVMDQSSLRVRIGRGSLNFGSESAHSRDSIVSKITDCNKSASTYGDDTTSGDDSSDIDHNTSELYLATHQRISLPRLDKVSRPCSAFLFTFLATISLVVILIFCLLVLNSKIERRWICSGPRQPLNMTTLSSEMSFLFGQHLVSTLIMSNMAEYINSDDTGRPLLLAFRGSTGVGKTYAARLLATALTSQGARVHWHLDNAEPVRDWVLSRLSACNLNVFIFEDIDLDPGWVSVELRELLCQWTDLGLGGDGSGAVFITISSEGSQLINEVAVDWARQNGSRGDIRIADVLLFKDDSESSWCHKQVIVPFLPLERIHVIQCLTKIVDTQNIWLSPEEILNYASLSLAYFPESFPIFSKLGCKQLKLH